MTQILLIPAAPGTYAIEMGVKDVLKTPIIAWAPDAENPYSTPVAITARGTALTGKGRAILHPCGMVMDPRVSACFGSLDEWKQYAKAGSSETKTEAPSRLPAEIPTGASPLGIQWMTKPFKTASFYHYSQDDVEFVFEVPAGETIPKQKTPITKIKRSDFMDMKKTVDVGEIAELLEGRYPGMTDLGEDFTAEAVDEDDLDAMDLI